MGDDIHDNYFEIDETNLLERGGGGAYQGEEEASDLEEASPKVEGKKVTSAVSVSSGKQKQKDKIKISKNRKNEKEKPKMMKIYLMASIQRANFAFS